MGDIIGFCGDKDKLKKEENKLFGTELNSGDNSTLTTKETAALCKVSYDSKEDKFYISKSWNSLGLEKIHHIRINYIRGRYQLFVRGPIKDKCGEFASCNLSKEDNRLSCLEGYEVKKYELDKGKGVLEIIVGKKKDPLEVDLSKFSLYRE